MFVSLVFIRKIPLGRRLVFFFTIFDSATFGQGRGAEITIVLCLSYLIIYLYVDSFIQFEFLFYQI